MMEPFRRRLWGFRSLDVRRALRDVSWSRAHRLDELRYEAEGLELEAARIEERSEQLASEVTVFGDVRQMIQISMDQLAAARSAAEAGRRTASLRSDVKQWEASASERIKKVSQRVERLVVDARNTLERLLELEAAYVGFAAATLDRLSLIKPHGTAGSGRVPEGERDVAGRLADELAERSARSIAWVQLMQRSLQELRAVCDQFPFEVREQGTASDRALCERVVRLQEELAALQNLIAETLFDKRGV